MKRGETTPSYYPILLKINGKRCLVVGGGMVALRRVQTLTGHGADVVIISPDICPELEQLSKDDLVRITKRDYKPEDLNGAYLAVAATDDAVVNEKVAAEAKRIGILVNVVDRPDISDFIVPSQFSRGDIIVAVSTCGKSPALARKIRSELESELKAEYAQLAVIASEVRSELKETGVTVSAEDWQKALDLNSLIELIRRGKNREAKEIMLAKLRTSVK
jgi:siroheme synthase-like protein